MPDSSPGEDTGASTSVRMIIYPLGQNEDRRREPHVTEIPISGTVEAKDLIKRVEEKIKEKEGAKKAQGRETKQIFLSIERRKLQSEAVEKAA